LRVDATPHGFADVIERQGEAAAQLDDEGFFAGGHRRGQAMRQVERSSTSWRAFQRATVRLWMPSSRARALFEAALC